MLTETQIKKAALEPKPYRLSDGGGLFLLVRPTGSKQFVKAYRFDGKQRTDNLGEFPAVKLADARARSTEISRLVKGKIDPRDGDPRFKQPVAAEPKDDGPQEVPVERRIETVADMFVNKRIQEGIADATADKLRWNMGVVTDHFKGRDIASVKPPEVLALVERIQATGKLDKAKDVHRKMGQLFDYATALGHVEWNPARMVQRAVIRKPGGKHPGLTEPKKVGELMRAIRGYTGQIETRAALLLSAYTVLRSSELRGARWREIDVEARLWTVPGARMKGHYGDHLVPLSDQALLALEYLRGADDDPDAFLFPALGYGDRYMSNATMNAALRRLGYDTRTEHTQHGFRTTFSTTMNEKGWNRDWIERQLCHVDRDEVRSAYNKALYLEGRTKLMQAYADWLDEVGG